MVYFSLMEKPTNPLLSSKDEERLPALAPYLLLALALAAVFCWRVASTDPSWSGAAPAEKPASTQTN